MKSRLVSIVIFILLLFKFASDTYAQQCVMTKGSAIFRENVEEGIERAKKIALARGVIKVLGKKIPLQFLKARYAIIKKHIVSRAEDFATDVKVVRKIIHGHSVKLLLCVKWNENLLTTTLESLTIIPEGILPPPLQLKIVVKDFSFPVTEKALYSFLSDYIRSYGFPITTDNYRYAFLIKVSSRPIRPFPLIVSPSEIRIKLVVTGNNNFRFNSGEVALYPFATSDFIMDEIKSVIREGLEKVRLNWFMHIKKLNRLVITVPVKFKNKFVRIMTDLMKNSSYASLVRAGQFFPDALTLVVYYGKSVSKDEVIEEISSVLARDLGLTLKKTEGGIEVEESASK